MTYSMIKHARPMHGRRIGVPFLAVLLTVLFSPATNAGPGQEGAAQTSGARNPRSEEVHPLASKEEMIRDRFERFEDRVYRLREQLVEGEPDNASRLGRVLQRAGELGLSDRLNELIELLRDPSALNDATDAQRKWLSDADRLLAILLERDSENAERIQEIERLQDYHDKVTKILEEQRGLRQATGEQGKTPAEGEQDDQTARRDTGELAKQQKQLSDETGDLSAQMEQDTSAGGGSQGQQGGKYGGQQGASSSARQNLDQAQREMEDAAEALEQANPGQATKPQDRAIDQLRQAQRQLEQALDQLRQEQREETLRDLEARFREMLAKQRPINEATVRIDKTGRRPTAAAAREFRRAEQLELADLSVRQRALSQDAAACLHILEEDGTTVAFPRVVEQLSDDMGTVAERLALQQVGALTQTIEEEIVETLEQLLEAVQRMQQENEQQQGMPATQADGSSPLLPPSAELKLLRASQLRINTRTRIIASARSDRTEPAEALADALRKVARRQVQCADIAKEMRDRRGKP